MNDPEGFPQISRKCPAELGPEEPVAAGLRDNSTPFRGVELSRKSPQPAGPASEAAGFPANVPQISRKPLVDMRRPVDVERLLIWAYRDQRAHVIINLGLGLEAIEAGLDDVVKYAISGDGCVAVAAIAELGCRVDTSPTRMCDLHPDAERVHIAVSALDKPVQMMVIRCALMAERPNWLPGARPKAQAQRGRRGAVHVRYADSDKNRNYGWCPVEWHPSLAFIEAMRREYTMWHQAVADVSKALRKPGILKSHRIAGFIAPDRPWAKPFDFTQSA